ncbi:glutathione S-transferase family protein [Caulobacter sp. 17J65-9]|uniref:glutathione S-transferase family protein n=1 Tax=Caulobacter sp. 17J65-9 TaxID=2709382 RepID=UPI0013C6399A|nr:glutathione S-transferase family protein [Caulobacter sp. 17J65-9]NEX93524.1 glutathione S-transferase family protein [Caulobacter sp. 17J65-9]
MKLYYAAASTVCRPIVQFLLEHDLPVELVPVDMMKGEHKSPAFLAVNPNGAVPAFVDGDLRIPESAAILRYLATIAGSPAYPAEPKARARVDSALDWFNTGFYRDHGYGVIYPQVLPHYPVHKTDDLLAWHTDKANARLKVLNDHMIGEGTWVAGDQPTIADFFGAALVSLSEMTDFDLTPYPNVRRWLAAVQARPSWAEANGAFNGWCAMLKGAAAQPA